MIETTLIDTATAYVSTSLMPCPMDSSSVGIPTLAGRR